MDLFADRMARAMDKLIAIAAGCDHLPTGLVHLPAERSDGRLAICCPGRTSVPRPALADQVKNLACFVGTV